MSSFAQHMVGAQIKVLPKRDDSYPTDDLIEACVGAVGIIASIQDDGYFGPDTLNVVHLKIPDGEVCDSLWLPRVRAEVVGMNQWEE